MAGSPLVGVTIARGIWHSSQVPVHYTPEAYIRALSAVGVIPLLIPATLGEAELRPIFERVDGLLLTGGGDVHPCFACLDENNAPFADDIDSPRDQTELQLIRWAFHEDKPLLGVCRGIQVMNVALGGSLIMDIPTLVGTGVPHLENLPRDRTKFLHHIKIKPHTRLAHLAQDGEIPVNSIHHQAIERVADCLCPSAHAPDGVIEAIEAEDKQFFLGVQWHPEEIYPHSPASERLFSSFAESMRA